MLLGIADSDGGWAWSLDLFDEMLSFGGGEEDLRGASSIPGLGGGEEGRRGGESWRRGG